jgi:hypothetical protein
MNARNVILAAFAIMAVLLTSALLTNVLLAMSAIGSAAPRMM